MIISRLHAEITSGFYPYTWWAQLAPIDKYGGSFDKVVNQNSPLFSLGKLHT